MKSDLDALMMERELDAIMVIGGVSSSPSMYYLLGGGHVSGAVIVKKRDELAVVYCNAMEREEAAKSGLKVVPARKGVFEEFIENGRMIFEAEELTSGRIGLYGDLDVGSTIMLLDLFKSIVPDVEFVGEIKNSSMLLYAMETKDENEVARIRQMGTITTDVVAKVREYLTSCDVSGDEILLKDDGTHLTVGDVHRKISLWVAEHNVELPSGFIFSIGRDAGLPHSVGNPEDLMKLGQTIVFDIYPAEKGGGYYYDFTRTWSLGYAKPEAQKLYDEVKDVYNKVIENVDLNASFKEYQLLVCEEFGKNGHNTPMNSDGVLTEGYVHSLGHGLGLNIHERPLSRHTV
ncbi:MAG TPA: M24 family metallopeptidase, partial [Anaerolineales bacterium]|nr:M24 family metallopeptidase [Anaerolineales bacterium]